MNRGGTVEHEPSDREVNDAIDALADKALRGVTGTSGHAWNVRSDIKRQADLLKKALARPVSERYEPLSPSVLADALQDRIVPASGKLIKAKLVRVEGLNTSARVNRRREVDFP